MKRFTPVALALLLTACAQPGGPASEAAAGATGPGKRAATCVIAGGRLTGKNTSAHPTMTVSSDGFCNVSFRAADSTAMSMQLQTLPQHGRIVAGDPGMAATVRYYPTAGYEGPDSFTVATGSGGASVSYFAVTVVKP